MTATATPIMSVQVIEKSEDKNLMFSQYVPELMDPILGDYARNIPDTRDPEVRATRPSNTPSVWNAFPTNRL